MINWPTAFVIAVAICAGAFLYNKPSDAAFHGNSDQVIRILDTTDGYVNRSQWLQIRGDKMRRCHAVKDKAPSFIRCNAWYTD